MACEWMVDPGSVAGWLLGGLLTLAVFAGYARMDGGLGLGPVGAAVLALAVILLWPLFWVAFLLAVAAAIVWFGWEAFARSDETKGGGDGLRH